MDTQGMLSKMATIKLPELRHKAHTSSSALSFSLTQVRCLRNENTQQAMGALGALQMRSDSDRLRGHGGSSPSRVTASGGAPRSDNPTWSLLL